MSSLDSQTCSRWPAAAVYTPPSLTTANGSPTALRFCAMGSSPSLPPALIAHTDFNTRTWLPQQLVCLLASREAHTEELLKPRTFACTRPMCCCRPYENGNKVDEGATKDFQVQLSWERDREIAEARAAERRVKSYSSRAKGSLTNKKKRRTSLDDSRMLRHAFARTPYPDHG